MYRFLLSMNEATALLSNVKTAVTSSKVILIALVASVLLILIILLLVSTSVGVPYQLIDYTTIYILDESDEVQMQVYRPADTNYEANQMRHLQQQPNIDNPNPRKEAVSVYLNCQIYLIGGITKVRDTYKSTPGVFKYDLAADRWSRAPTLTIARSEHTANVLNGTIYTCGCNVNKDNCQYTCESLSVNGTRWSLLPAPSPHCSRFSASAVVALRLYLIGSYCPWKNAQVHSYNLVDKSWSRHADLLQGRSGAAAVALGQLIYVCGGIDQNFHHLSSCECYDTNTNKWSNKMPKMRRRRAWLEMVIIKGYLYAIGGHEGTKHLASVEMWAPGYNQWTLLGDVSLHVPSDGHTAVAVPDC